MMVSTEDVLSTYLGMYTHITMHTMVEREGGMPDRQKRRDFN